MTMTAEATARAVRSGDTTASACVAAALAAIGQHNGALNAFTAVVSERALAKARAIDALRARGGDPGPLAGVPFAAKNLFDIEGVVTVSGSAINRSHAPARRDALLIQRLEDAGAVLVGALNMGEYAYDFTGENVHYGASRNPHDTSRMSGGSSGGSASAVAGGLVPIALGSDTNGSLRVPAALCGIFSLKPTYGRLPRTGTFPFVASLDHLGGFARGVTDLALSYDAMQGHDGGDAGCSTRAAEPVLQSLEGGAGRTWKVARLDGYFADGASADALLGLDMVAAELGAVERVTLDLAQAARASAYLITTTEAAALHIGRLRTRAGEFEPIVRDRLLSGAMIPASIVTRAHKVRALFAEQLMALLRDADALIAPATPCTAPSIGQQMLDLGGRSVPLRANIGLYTQPFSFSGFPVVTVPVPLSPLPVGVQIITAPWREDAGLAIARRLELSGICRAPIAEPFRTVGRDHPT